jgi:predicted Zn-dependent protease
LLAGRQGDFESAAEKEFVQELELDPTSANAAYELGELHRRRGQLTAARQMFGRALEHYPDFDEAHIGLGRVLLALEQPGPALKHLQQAVKLSPDNPVPYFHLARAHQSAGNAAEQQNAMAAFRRILSDSLKRQQSGMKILSPQEVTRQEMDPGAVTP